MGYSVSMDIQGYIVEKLSGKPLPEFMRENVYSPLGMKDAGFYVPQEKWSRFATVYWVDPMGGLSATGPQITNRRDFDREPALPSGGGGMVSTAEDYYRFAQMLANGGALDGKRILSPASVKLMSSNHLPPNLLTGEFSIGLQVSGRGLAMDTTARWSSIRQRQICGGQGHVSSGTARPARGSGSILRTMWCFVGMIQRMGAGPNSENLQYLSRSVVYGALVDPAK